MTPRPCALSPVSCLPIVRSANLCPLERKPYCRMQAYKNNSKSKVDRHIIDSLLLRGAFQSNAQLTLGAVHLIRILSCLLVRDNFMTMSAIPFNMYRQLKVAR